MTSCGNERTPTGSGEVKGMSLNKIIHEKIRIIRNSQGAVIRRILDPVLRNGMSPSEKLYYSSETPMTS